MASFSTRSHKERASSVTVDPAPTPQPYSTKPYPGRGRSFRKGGSSYRKSGRDRDQSRSTPSATVTRPSKSGSSQATMTVTVPQDSNKRQVQRVLPVASVNINRGSLKMARKNEGVLPPQSVPVGAVCGFVKAYNE